MTVSLKDVSAAGRASLQSELAPYAGLIVPENQTVLGNPRFSFKSESRLPTVTSSRSRDARRLNVLCVFHLRACAQWSR